jgi:membrane protein insertase Oxa1/YidC/SpoIIIJ
VLVYWVTQNCLSIGQTILIKLPALRRFFGMPARPLPVVETDSKVAPMTFWEGLQAGAKIGEANKAAKRGEGTLQAGTLALEQKPASGQQVRLARKPKKGKP